MLITQLKSKETIVSLVNNKAFIINCQGCKEVSCPEKEAKKLQKELVAVLVGKAAHLVLNGGAVARAGALDIAAEHGRTVQVFADDAVRFSIGVNDVAGQLRNAGKIILGGGVGKGEPVFLARL